MPEFSAAALREVLTRVQRQGITAARAGLIATADAMVKQAKTNASTGRHAWGTPTPATPGTGPAVISGTLRRSIIREAVKRSADGWETKVGLRPDQLPPYNSRTPSSRYGLYLETGLKNGARYPFLEPASRLAGVQAEVNFRTAFAAIDWTAAASAD
ncbi:hypothetical protein E6W39_24185 [Kitasatospora acidiphila]|uniref:HK97 gp10 family phage protein n=1 Tax=Kitasatospora acidiphila TaxID=2567942 RepID=A0A540W6W1_9ACTN|nr:hypothetical protein [Kitasatospora acidiphila]TQF04756.1 hypothetical protein E6W39_24185 [Kitasatospora acidiphila]